MPKMRLSSKGLASACAGALLLGLSLGFAGPAEAEKVGVAAAVNPDAFSSLSGTPTKQLNIGKSIFYDERINTSASGLVQVLLVDGSTFTVGPNSNLVIDKFVYNPKKKTGEMVATFSKGTMRFIGGKLSKNDGGVKVNTPAGVLAIRGGMVQGNGTIWSFLYGVQMTFTGNNGQTHTVFENGYTLDLSGGTPIIRPTTPEDTALLMSLLSPGNGTGTNGGTQPPGSNGFQQAFNSDGTYDQIINEATATQIQDAIDREIERLFNNNSEPNNTNTNTNTNTNSDNNNPPPDTDQAFFGYAGGVYEQNGGGEGDDPAGTLINFSPTEVAALFDTETNTFGGASTTLYADGGGGAKIVFVPDAQFNFDGEDIPEELQGVSVFTGLASHTIDNSIKVFDDTVDGQLVNQNQLNSGSLVLVGSTGAGDVLCTNCDFLTWGLWATLDPLNFQTGDDPHSTVDAIGWWVSGDIVKDVAGALPTTGMAYYDGRAIGEVWNTTSGHDGPIRYTSVGNMFMDWDFASRTGNFEVTEFDKKNHGGYIPGGIDFGGELSAPGIVNGQVVPTGKPNQFSGGLTVTRAPSTNLTGITGTAIGSFVGATKLPGNVAGNPKGVIGNWNIGGNNYKAGGIFAGSEFKPQ